MSTPSSPPPPPPSSSSSSSSVFSRITLNMDQITKVTLDFVRSKLRTFSYTAKSIGRASAYLYKYVAFRLHPFWIELAYFSTLALIGSLAMFTIEPRSKSLEPRFVDMLYMSTAAVTVSGLNSIDTELFSEAQIVVLTVLMFVGGEVFVSLLYLLFRRVNTHLIVSATAGANTVIYTTNSTTTVNPVDVEMPVVTDMWMMDQYDGGNIVVITSRSASMENIHKDKIKRNAIIYLGYVVLAYILVFHIVGFLPVLLYLNVVSSARGVLKSKGLRIVTFSVSIVVSSFANGGLIPANENMGRFKSNSGLLLMLVPLILAGNTLFPACLRTVLWLIKRWKPTPEFDLILDNPSELEYNHLFPTTVETAYQSLTAVGLLTAMITWFCSMNWNSDVLSGLNAYQKFVGVFFQSVNSRHSGEGVFDFSIIAPAVLVLFIVLMYLPAYTTFSTAAINGSNGTEKKRNYYNPSQVAYVILFVIIACALERKKISKDPLNFNMLNMVFEVVSAYGNVGLSMGYSCGRMVTPDSTCVDGGYSFSGRWSDGGKVLVIIVMLFGRLKRYHMGGGEAWKLR